MCAIIGWAGRLPNGALDKMIVSSESRGVDSTGLAFRNARNSCSICYRQAVSASTFVEIHKDVIKMARRSYLGISHARRASPGMPVDSKNAHPYCWPYGRHAEYIFAHNGRIENWKDIKKALVKKYAGELEEKLKSSSNVGQGEVGGDEGLSLAASKLVYAEKVTTDSMVLGPYIEKLDFSELFGCMSLVWLHGPKAYVYRSAKEAVAACIRWRLNDKSEDGPTWWESTVVASTEKIIEHGLSGLPIEVKLEFLEIKENVLYEILPGGLNNLGGVPPPKAVEDKFSSQLVKFP